MPHARTVSDSLSRLFRGGSSEGNLEAMDATAASSQGADTGSAKRSGREASLGGRSQGGSPRSIVSRTFSLSNLFGLASGW